MDLALRRARQLHGGGVTEGVVLSEGWEQHPFATEIMGLVAWAVSKEGPVVGPVGPVGLALVSGVGGWDIAWHVRFLFAPVWDAARVPALTFDEVYTSVAGTVRRNRTSRLVLRPGDTLTYTYTMNAVFDSPVP